MVQQLTHQFTELRDQRQQEHAPYRGNGGYRGSARSSTTTTTKERLPDSLASLWTGRSYKNRLQNKNGPFEEFKRQETCTEGQVLRLSKRNCGPIVKSNIVKSITPSGIFGKPTEAEIFLNGHRLPALLDTGSTVSTIAELFNQEYLSESTPLKKLDSILEIETAGRTQLPSAGYIEVDIKTPGKSNISSRHVFLVVPDIRYSQHVPALIETNILDHLILELQKQHEARYLQNAALTTPWYMTFRCISMRECTTPSILQSSELSKECKDIDIEPALHQYKQNGTITVRILMSNTTTRTFTIPPKSIICEIQPVTIEKQPKPEKDDG
ncbi:Hypothetical predicted protein [Mytilus galloprovincialis]|uniref:Uncharacterized protein n=1 Tax=Mytilus galloprovincialis TaxID=29158 RepID=A0A8B6FXP7_MYTGA|nr:Hypothetical predicted protein [Mytilus galloprovincialis]